MNQTLQSNRRVYVEYRSCCRAGLAPGWDSVAWHRFEDTGFIQSSLEGVKNWLVVSKCFKHFLLSMRFEMMLNFDYFFSTNCIA